MWKVRFGTWKSQIWITEPLSFVRHSQIEIILRSWHEADARLMS